MNNSERPIVDKFGGHSMYDADTIRQSAEIVRSDPDRRFIVVSAPKGITDLLRIASTQDGLPDDNGLFSTLENREAAFAQATERFSVIGQELGCRDVNDWIDQVRQGVFSDNDIDWSMSRGEWLMAKIFANYLGATFIDAEEIIRIRGDRYVDPVSYGLIGERLLPEQGVCIIPGYYGLDEMGHIRTFPRGGSDITGAVMARGINARLYENWTNTNGVLAANPKIFPGKELISINELTLEEMREMGNGGTTVLQRDAILPLIDTDILLIVKNTFNPNHPGTKIVRGRQKFEGEHVIGVASEEGFISVNIQKHGMNEEIGVGRGILEQFESSGVSYEHNPSGRDYVSVIVNRTYLDRLSSIMDNLRRDIQPDRIWVQENLGLLSLVGQGIEEHATRVSRMLFSALDDASIPVKAFSYGASGISMVVAVDNDRLEEAVKLAYEFFIEKK